MRLLHQRFRLSPLDAGEAGAEPCRERKAVALLAD